MLKRTLFKVSNISGLTILAALILFTCSSARHAMFQSTAFDLGYFDQALYLISIGQKPIVSFWGYHFLGGHADWILYGLAGFYKVYPSVYWLFIIQAVSLASTTIPCWYLSRLAGLKDSQAFVVALAYLLYPLVFNLNLFDFHPEVIALPMILLSVWAAKTNRKYLFVALIVLILGCRDALSITIAAMGVWLLFFEKKRFFGGVALVAGIAWFVIATQVIIPAFRPDGVEAIARYSYLGNSLSEIIQNLFIKPQLILGKVFSLETFGYLALLFFPVVWGFSLQAIAPLIAACPTLLINILAEQPLQRDLLHQYSLPILPFLILAIISTLASGKGLIRNRRMIIIWSLIAFIALAKFGYFWTKYTVTLNNNQAIREAISLIQTQKAVLTTAQIAPHLTHRSLIQLALSSSNFNLTDFDYVLLNIRYPGWNSTSEFATNLAEQLKKMPNFNLSYNRDDVLLFKKVGI